MTPTEASNKLKNEMKEIKTIKECRDYGKDFIFVAFETDTPDVELDPFYLVNKNTGDIRRYTIAENPSKFYSAPKLKF